MNSRESIDSEAAVFSCQVAVCRPLSQLYTYKVPPCFQGTVSVGSRVEVPFGRTHVMGFIVSLSLPVAVAPDSGDGSEDSVSIAAVDDIRGDDV
jgi:hypothetical protein